MVNVESRAVIDFEIVQRTNTPGWGNHQGSSNGIELEVEAMRRTMKKWEDDQKVSVVVTDQDARMASVIRESPWNVRHEHNANHTKKTVDHYYQKRPKEQRQGLYGLGRRARDRFNHVLHEPSARDKKIEMWANTLNHDCGDHSKCDHPAHQGYQWKSWNMPEARASL
jgi:glutamate-1-semialdehyde aminotransferase